ncbi:MAG: ABC transporter permease, partial [Candidatus Omnitrophica bacterium]|nr:ABC transporter permease [Candidatus Omnitrophota bacterium]
MWERITTIIIKEFIQALRDPKMRVVIFVTPVVQLIVFSLAVSTDVRKIPTAVYDLDNTAESRRLIRNFVSSGYFVPKYYIGSDNGQKRLIDQSRVSTVIRVNRG